MTYNIASWRALSHNVLVVATLMQPNDWAAYIDAVPGDNHDKEKFKVAETGAKLSEELAEIIFPALAEKYKYRP